MPISITVFINQYSLVLAGCIIIVLVGLLGWRFFGVKISMVSAGTILFTLIILQLTSSTSATSINSHDEFERALTAGKPVFLELYSNF
jgi:hypothetical protein